MMIPGVNIEAIYFNRIFLEFKILDSYPHFIILITICKAYFNGFHEAPTFENVSSKFSNRGARAPKKVIPALALQLICWHFSNWFICSTIVYIFRFGSIYRCKKKFPAVKPIKTRNRVRLTDTNLNSLNMISSVTVSQL